MLILLTLASAMALERLPLTRHVHKYLLPPSSRRAAVPLQGNFPDEGEYYMDVLVGGQTLSLLIDTGSGDVGISAVGCHGCTKKSHLSYDPSKSPNATAIGCDWCTAHQGRQCMASSLAAPLIMSFSAPPSAPLVSSPSAPLRFLTASDTAPSLRQPDGFFVQGSRWQRQAVHIPSIVCG